MRLLSILCFFLLLSGCFSAEGSPTAEYRKISSEEAKEMMSASGVVILDVRTQEEYDAGHIEGSILIPDFEIAGREEEFFPDKSATILIYCRSGRRSENVARALVEKGHTAVYDFGGILDWPYDVIT